MRPLTAQTPAKQAASSTAMVNSVTSNVDWTFESVGDHEIQTCSRSLACVFFLILCADFWSFPKRTHFLSSSLTWLRNTLCNGQRNIPGVFKEEHVCSSGINAGSFCEVNSRIIHQKSKAHLIQCFANLPKAIKSKTRTWRVKLEITTWYLLNTTKHDYWKQWALCMI